MSATTIHGSCLCGKISYLFTGPARGFQYCHCSRCQKITGSAHGAIMFVKPEQFQWTKGTEHLSRYELPEAQFYASSFCRNCGASLPWETQDGSTVAIPAGSLDEDPGIRPRRNIFWDSKACWFEDSGTLEKFAAAPVRKG